MRQFVTSRALWALIALAGVLDYIDQSWAGGLRASSNTCSKSDDVMEFAATDLFNCYRDQAILRQWETFYSFVPWLFVGLLAIVAIVVANKSPHVTSE